MSLSAFSRRTIPVGSKQNGHSLSLMFSVLIFLLSFVVVCVFTFSRGFSSWGQKPYKVTVEIPVGLQSQDPATHMQKVQGVVQDLKSYPGIISIQQVEPERLRDMLRSWVGEKGSDVAFPVPTLLDVSVNPHQKIDMDVLRQHLRKFSSDISLEDHNVWSKKLLTFSHSLNLITLIIGTFILLCVTAVVGLVTKSSLQAYSETLDVLRLLGAKNAYISRIFQRQILKSAFWGGLWGIALSLPTAYAFITMMKYLGLVGLTWQHIVWPLLGLVFLVPWVIACIGLLVSRLTITLYLRALDRP